MALYSRRQFLQIMGVTLAGSQIPFAFAESASYQGRPLTAAAVYTSRRVGSPVAGHLWPDSVTPILDAAEGWYRVPGGYVQREFLQPMTPYQPRLSPHWDSEPFIAEVAAPAASVRAHCAASAPLIARIGHGGVAQVVDFLPGEPNGWYGIADENGVLLGWTQAVLWQPADPPPPASGSLTLHVDVRRQQLTVWQNDSQILLAACSTGEGVKPGHYTVQNRQASSFHAGENLHGVPWLTRFNQGCQLAGVYWHNQFGLQTPGFAVQTTPLLAKWVYSQMSENSQMVIE